MELPMQTVVILRVEEVTISNYAGAMDFPGQTGLWGSPYSI